MQPAKLLKHSPSDADSRRFIKARPTKDFRHSTAVLGLVALVMLLVFIQYNIHGLPITMLSQKDSRSKACRGRSLYVYELPQAFNQDLVDRCAREQNIMCGNLENAGRGPQVDVNQTDGEIDLALEPAHCWYQTEQFSLELLFHERVKRFECLTKQAEHADAFYIPYYGALDTAFTMFMSELQPRDELQHRLVEWLSASDVWAAYGRSRPHFMVLGRTSWDFNRPLTVDRWGSALLTLPALSSVSALLIERQPDDDGREMGIPYPTSFHPSSDPDMKLWQERLLAHKERRRWLCTFVGSSKRGGALRTELVRQCKSTSECRLVSCNYGTVECQKRPERFISIFGSSTFCLQPPGDSPTRKGIFDSLVAGCIPVLFSERSAYTQYRWHLPGNGSLYSVFFEGKEVAGGRVDVMGRLAEVAKDGARVQEMQEAIVALLPAIVYRSADGPSEGALRDAVDVALDHIFTGTESS